MQRKAKIGEKAQFIIHLLFLSPAFRAGFQRSPIIYWAHFRAFSTAC
jgi:hypothetical protein